jgi:hypothetical protein
VKLKRHAGSPIPTENFMHLQTVFITPQYFLQHAWNLPLAHEETKRQRERQRDRRTNIQTQRELNEICYLLTLQI